MKLDLEKGRVDLTHGSGGRAMHDLISNLFAKDFDNPLLAEGNDQAICKIPESYGSNPRLSVSTDSFVISPLFFPGGNIGNLAVHGTVNDVALAGAKPLWLTAGFILEEGFPFVDLTKIVASMAQAAQEADVQIVTGDTKVVPKGKADGLFINTTGVGVVLVDPLPSVRQIEVGDAIIINGPIGDHAVAIMAARENLKFDEELLSDCASLNGLIEAMVQSGTVIHAMRDPTRGGLSATLNEMATSAKVGIHLDEAAIPVRPAVKGVCEILGLDPLNLANEGKLIAFCPQDQAEPLLQAMRAHPLGCEAVVIGHTTDNPHCFVEMKTKLGGVRMVDWLTGDQLPRIC
ncbi:MAG: hydrogenase expression/formation protein HypE [Proteobacteria bacterium]|nr:hydrogenase expression/formation protein HypE [Pseudomonadota bacterium]